MKGSKHVEYFLVRGEVANILGSLYESLLFRRIRWQTSIGTEAHTGKTAKTKNFDHHEIKFFGHHPKRPTSHAIRHET